MVKILCLGDALTHGVRSTRGWPEHLWANLDPATVIMLNRGLPPPAKVADVLRAMDLSMVKPDICIIGAPIYDAKICTPPKEYGLLLSQAVCHALIYSKRVILCTPTPIFARDGQPQGFGRDARRWLPKAVSAVHSAVETIDDPRLHGVNLSGMPEALLSDGVHPKPDGYKWIAEQLVRPVLTCMSLLR